MLYSVRFEQPYLVRDILQRLQEMMLIFFYQYARVYTEDDKNRIITGCAWTEKQNRKQ